MFSFKKKTYRIYIKKKLSFDIDSKKLYKKLKTLDNSIKKVITYYVYDFFNIKKKFILDFLLKVMVDPATEIFYLKKNFLNPYLEFISNKDEDRSNAAIKCIQILNPDLGNKIFIKSRLNVEIVGKNRKIISKIRKCILDYYSYVDFNNNQKLKVNYHYKKIIKNFITFSKDDFTKIHKKMKLSMEIKDLLFIQRYFQKERRNPNQSEISILDTYWSDHCRHTTFFTKLENFSFNGYLKNIYEKIFNKYLDDKKLIGKSKHPISLMDLSQLPSQLFPKKKGYVYVPNNENNACMILIDVFYSDQKKEKWYLFFKNETHNHPTEIDPFNGAYTCIGGAIRDPLSGRSFVYQSIRLSGSSDPKKNYKIFGKISQDKICYESALGYSSYGNRIGVSTTHVSEIYHEGYRAKKMEVGMVVGAVPVNFVKWEKPKKGDVVLLIGGLTGKEGIGDANQSSKMIDNYKNLSLKNRQKGDPIIGRQLLRLFRKKKVTHLIKKCNDLGAGGIAIALGELHDSMDIYLEKIPIKKDEIIDPIEIALSESQERMVVILSSKDVKNFIKLSYEENLMAIPVAKITESKRIIMFYHGKKIFDIKSSFLKTKGAKRNNEVFIDSPKSISPFKKSKEYIFNKKNFLKILSQLNIASQISLVEMFDSTVGGYTVLMPFGGKYQMTPSEGSAQKIPVFNGSTNTVSLASWGFHPEISSWSPFHGGIYSVLECISKIVSMGGNYKNIYLSFQEYYKKLEKNPKNWGIPFSSLLGAYYAQKSLEIFCIGGKDSMSGSYKNIHVPPTFITFGVTTESHLNIISPEFKKIGSKIYLYHHIPLKNEMPDFHSIKKVYNQIYNGILDKKILSVKTIKDGGISVAIAKMSFGNFLGAKINCHHHLLKTHIGSLIIESSSILSKDFILIGEVVQYQYLNFNGKKISINECIKSWSNTLNTIFNPIHQKINNQKRYYPFHIHKSIKKIKEKKFLYKSKKFGVPNVFIPIFPGTNGEYESIRSFQNAGSIVKTFVFKNINHKNIIESIDHIKKFIKYSQIFMICGGFSSGDEPNGSAKLITSMLHNPYIKESIQSFLNKDGLILGICNGFQGLIKSGLLPYGKICTRNKYSPNLISNKLNKHVSQFVQIKIISDQSPWLVGMKNKIYTLPISHGEGRFYAKKNVINVLLKKNQIAAQYVNLNGYSSLKKIYNPNGSIQSIESLLSQDGKIYGRMTHPERCFDNDLYKNIPSYVSNNHKNDSIFKNSTRYFL